MKYYFVSPGNKRNYLLYFIIKYIRPLIMQVLWKDKKRQQRAYSLLQKNSRQTFMMNDCCNYTCQKVCDVLSQRVIQIASLWGNNEYIKEFIIKGQAVACNKALFFFERRKINQNMFWIYRKSTHSAHNFFLKNLPVFWWKVCKHVRVVVICGIVCWFCWF